MGDERGEKWSSPQAVSDLRHAFPAGIKHLMPTMEEIPEEFRSGAGTPWNRWQAEWFFSGLKSRPTPKPGIDLDAAMRHLGTIQGSFDPKHEHKEAAVAYLASLWFEPLTEKAAS